MFIRYPCSSQRSRIQPKASSLSSLEAADVTGEYRHGTSCHPKQNTIWMEQITRGGPGIKQGRRLDSTNTEREEAPLDTHPNIGRSGDLTLRHKLP